MDLPYFPLLVKLGFMMQNLTLELFKQAKSIIKFNGDMFWVLAHWFNRQILLRLPGFVGVFFQLYTFLNSYSISSCWLRQIPLFSFISQSFNWPDGFFFMISQPRPRAFPLSIHDRRLDDRTSPRRHTSTFLHHLGSAPSSLLPAPIPKLLHTIIRFNTHFLHIALLPLKSPSLSTTRGYTSLQPPPLVSIIPI